MRLGLGVGLGGRQTGVGVRERGGARARDGTCRHDGGPAARAAEPALQLAREQELRQFAWAGNDAPPSARDDHGACVWSYCAHVCGATARAAACACSLVGSPVGRPCIAGGVWRSAVCGLWRPCITGGRHCVGCGNSSHPAALTLVVREAVERRGATAWGAGRGVWGAGCGVQCAGCGVRGAGCRGAGCRVQGYRVQGCGAQDAWYGVQRSGQGAGRTCRRRGGRRAAGRRAVWSRWAGSPRP